MRVTSIVLVLLAVPALARADLPPPEGYVETCNVDYYQRPGTQCAVCQGVYSDEHRCARQPELASMTQCCRTIGATTWTEVWCESSCPEPDVPGQGGGCAVGRRARGPWSLLGLAALALVVRRLR